MSAPLHEIRLYIETDDAELIERLTDAVAHVACPHDPTPDHECSIPWFVISSPADQPEVWREHLNR